MNRFQFFAELRKSLINTTKEITFPLINEELDKVDNIADQLAGVKWVKLQSITPTTFCGAQEYFINHRPIILFSNGEVLRAYEKVCSSCQSIVQWLEYDKKMKCLTCDKTFHVEFETGDLTCKRYYMKESNGVWFIGDR